MKRSILLLSFATSTLIAQATSLYTNESEPLENVAAYGDFGISFKLNADINVTELNFFAHSLGGGDTPYVQLWNDDEDTLLASATWSAGDLEAGWNAHKLKKAITLKRGVTYQIQSSAYWVPTYIKREFLFNEVVESSKFYQNDGWTDWSAPTTPSSGSLMKDPAAMVNLTFEAE